MDVLPYFFHRIFFKIIETDEKPFVMVLQKSYKLKI